MSIPSPGWMLEHIPFISYFAADDEANSLRLLCGAKDTLFGYPVSELKASDSMFRAAQLSPEDRAVLMKHRETVWMGRDPVISRVRIPHQAQGDRTCLVVSHAIYEGGLRIGTTGVVIDVSGIAELSGPSSVLSTGDVGKNWNQRATLPEEPDSEWLVEVLPVAFVVSENDPNYTIRHLSGSMERVVGYTSDDILNGRPKSWSLIDPTQIDLADEKLEQAIAKGQSVILRVTLSHANGSRVPILAVVAPYMPAGHPSGFFVSAVLDISGAPTLQGETGTFVVSG